MSRRRSSRNRNDFPSNKNPFPSRRKEENEEKFREEIQNFNRTTMRRSERKALIRFVSKNARFSFDDDDAIRETQQLYTSSSKLNENFRSDREYLYRELFKYKFLFNERTNEERAPDTSQ